MDLKKILGIVIIIIIIAVVGFMLLGGSNNQSNNGVPTVSAEIVESSLTYTLQPKTSEAGQSTGSFVETKEYSYDGYIKIKINNATPEELQQIKDLMTNETSSNGVPSCHLSDNITLIHVGRVLASVNSTIDGDVITINIKNYPNEISNHASEALGSSGTVTVAKGSWIIWDYSETPDLIQFMDQTNLARYDEILGIVNFS